MDKLTVGHQSIQWNTVQQWKGLSYWFFLALMVKNPPTDAGDLRDMGSIPGSERSPGEGSGYPLQNPCLENPMDKGAWWATVHGLAKSQT